MKLSDIYSKNDKLVIEKIILNLSNSDIVSDKEHINIMEEIEQEISSKLNVSCKILQFKD
jgi:hypothetical protein